MSIKYSLETELSGVFFTVETNFTLFCNQMKFHPQKNIRWEELIISIYVNKIIIFWENIYKGKIIMKEFNVAS